MSRWAHLLLFILGALLFGHLLADMGPGRLWTDAMATGWMMIPIVLLYGVVYACDTRALQLILADEARPPTFGRALVTIVSGAALNFTTPWINAGGEPYKIATLAPVLGTRRAAGAVVLHTMLHTLSLLLVWLTAVVLGLILLPRTPLTMGVLVVGGALVGLITGLLLAAHRRGGLARALDWLNMVPGLSRLAVRLEPKRAALQAIDSQITDFYHGRTRRFLAALGLEYLSRCVFMVEFCLIGASVGVRVSYLDAFTIGGLEALIGNALFFVPFGIGTREGATYLLFQQLGYPPGFGLYAALVGRVRDLLWIALGLLLIWVEPRRDTVTERTYGGAST